MTNDMLEDKEKLVKENGILEFETELERKINSKSRILSSVGKQIDHLQPRTLKELVNEIFLQEE